MSENEKQEEHQCSHYGICNDKLVAVLNTALAEIVGPKAMEVLTAVARRDYDAVMKLGVTPSQVLAIQGLGDIAGAIMVQQEESLHRAFEAWENQVAQAAFAKFQEAEGGHDPLVNLRPAGSC